MMLLVLMEVSQAIVSGTSESSRKFAEHNIIVKNHSPPFPAVVKRLDTAIVKNVYVYRGSGQVKQEENFQGVTLLKWDNSRLKTGQINRCRENFYNLHFE